MTSTLAPIILLQQFIATSISYVVGDCLNQTLSLDFVLIFYKIRRIDDTCNLGFVSVVMCQSECFQIPIE